MVQRGKLPEPTTAAQLAKLKPLKPKGGKMTERARLDPEKAKYLGTCCSPGGMRVWGLGEADVFIDELGGKFAVFVCGGCKEPLPLPPVPVPVVPGPAPDAPSPVTVTAEQRARMEESRQAALARRASVRAAREDEERRARLEEQEARVRLAAAHPQTHDWAEKGHVQFVDQVLPDVD